MNIYLRDATEKDRELLFQWANDVEVRKNSFSSEKISYEEHCEWFTTMMKDESCVQWILQVDETPVGQIRLELNGKNAEINYSICRERRGEGFGTLLLNLVLLQVKQKFPNIKTLVAKVKPTNIASLKAFESSGYKSVFQQFELEISR